MDRLPRVADAAFKQALSERLDALAREIKRRDRCTDDQALSKAMQEYDRLVLETARKIDSQARHRRLGLLASGKPTLGVSLGDALRAKRGAE